MSEAETVVDVGVKKKRRRTMLKTAAIQGACGVALFVALEVGFRVVADGHPDPEVRLFALALSVSAGAFVGAMRKGGSAAMLLGASLAGGPVEAADRGVDYTVTISSAACPTGTPGLISGKEPGISLAGLRAWNATICPAVGQTITGAGLLRACVYRRSPGGPNQWALSQRFVWNMADDGLGNPITTTLSNPCHTFEDVAVGIADGDLLYLYPSTTFGVSGGTTLRILMKGSY